MNLEVLYLTRRSIEQYQPKSNKLNKNIPITKTLEAFTPKAKFHPFKYTHFKNM